LEGEYDEGCDIWSAGVILYTLLCGYPPFYGNSNTKVIQMIKNKEYDFPKEEWDCVSK